MLISNVSMSKVKTINCNKFGIILKRILFSLQKTQLGRFELTSLMSEPVVQGDVFLTQYCVYRGQRVKHVK